MTHFGQQATLLDRKNMVFEVKANRKMDSKVGLHHEWVLWTWMYYWNTESLKVLPFGWWIIQWRDDSVQFSHSVSVTPRTEAHQASLSITNSQSLLKLMSIELVIPSNHLILCRPLLLLPSIFPSIRVFPRSQFFAPGGQGIGVSALVSVIPMNIQEWFPLGRTGLNSLQSKGLTRVLSNITVQKDQLFGTQLS